MSKINMLSNMIWDWGVSCFGIDHMRNPKVRGLRFIEEAVEVAQALDIPRERMIDVINIVYSKPPGQMMEELGGALLTLSVLCRLVSNKDMDEILEIELRRCLAKPAGTMTKRNEERNKLGLDGKH